MKSSRSKIQSSAAGRLLLIAAVLVGLLGLMPAIVTPAEAVGPPPPYYPFGPQANVPVASLVGWQVCWSGLYGASTPSLATIQNQCSGDYLLLAGRPVGSLTITVLAAGPRADVLFDTGGSGSPTRDTPHVANGVGWYYNANWSWGYARAGDPIQRYSCDVQSANANLRLCWHTGGGMINSGYRAGANFLNGNNGWDRLIYQPVAVLDNLAPTAAPTQSPAANGAGWNNSNVTVNWNWTDNVSGTGINPAFCTTSSVSSGEGDPLILAATCKDLAGNTGNASYAVKVDKTNPTIAGSRSPAANGAGWNNSDVTVQFTCTDVGGSGLPAGACPANEVLSAEGAAVASTAQAVTDAAGNTSDPSNVVTVQIDKTAPTISAATTTSPNGAGWYSSDVTVAFTCIDNLSGIPTGNCPAEQVLSAEGAGVASTAQTVTDAADNTSNPSNVVVVNIDKTAPTCTAVATPNSLWPPNHKMVDISTSVTVADGGSGSAGFTLISVTSNEPDNGLGDGDKANDAQGWSLGADDTNGQLRAERAGGGPGRIYTLTYQALDQAGNAGTCSATVTVPHDKGK